MDVAEQCIGLGFSVPKRGKLHIAWTLDNFSKIETPVGESIYSAATKADVDGISTSWNIEFYPNGASDAQYLSVYLNLEDTISNSLLVRAKHTISVGNVVNHGEMCQHTNDDCCWGEDQLIAREKLFEDAANSLPNDKLTIVLDADITITARLLNNIHYSETPEFSDITIRCVKSLKHKPRVELAKLRAHRFVLGHFSDTFQHRLVKSSKEHISFEDKPAVVRCFVRLAYNEKLSLEELSDNAIGLLSFAGHYEIELLLHLAESFLINRLATKDADEVARLLRAADDASAETLKSACVSYFRNNRDAMRNCNEFKLRKLSEDLLKELIGEDSAGPVAGVLQLLDSSAGSTIADCTVRCVQSNRAKRQGTSGASTSTGRSTASTVLREFKTHRLVLCSRSDVFRAMFANPNSEETKKGIVTVPDVSPDVMSVFLDLFHNRPVNDADLDMHAEGLFYALDKYQSFDLKAQIEARLRRLLNTDNCVHQLVLADQHNADAFKCACLSFICDNWQDVRPTIDPVSIDSELLKEVMDALRQA